MTSVLHLFDDSHDATLLQVLATLSRRHDADGHEQTLCRLGAGPCRWAGDPPPVNVEHVTHRLPKMFHYVPGLSRIASRSGAGLVHAWGLEAAAAAGARLGDLPQVMTILNPAAVQLTAGWLRSLPHEATIAAGSQVIRSRLISRGVSPERVLVIRGPADFAAVNKAKQSDLRRTLLSEGGPVVLMDGPASRGGGQYYGLWACAVVRKVLPALRVLLPYDSKESRRLHRFIRQIGMADMVIVPDLAWSWSQLVACADVFMCPAVDETCTEPLASAMAAGLPIVGSAVRSITEMIADKHNGLLCKPGDPRALASKLLTAIEDTDLRRRITEVARGQAYEVFGVRDFADNYARLYENVLAHRPAADGIRDTAMVA